MPSSTTTTPPPGALDVLAAIGCLRRAGSTTCWCCHSLSKRSSAAGLRSGFAVGAQRHSRRAQSRAPQRHRHARRCPLLAAATALWSEDAHVEAMRARLRRRKDMADQSAGRIRGLLPPALRLLPVDSRRRRRGAYAAPLARLRPARCCRAHFSPNPMPTERQRGGTPSSGSRSSTTPTRRAEGLTRLAWSARRLRAALQQAGQRDAALLAKRLTCGLNSRVA